MAHAKPHVKDTAVDSNQQMPASKSGASPSSPRFLNADEAAQTFGWTAVPLCAGLVMGMYPLIRLARGNVSSGDS